MSYRFDRLGPEPWDNVRPFLTHATDDPRQFLHIAELGNVRLDLWLHELQQIQENGGTLHTASARGAIHGLVGIEPVAWDAKILQCPVFRILTLTRLRDDATPERLLGELLSHALDGLHPRGRTLVLARCNARDTAAIHALESAGFALQDTLLDFVFDAARNPIDSVSRPAVAPEVRIRAAGPGDIEGLVSVAEASFATHFGRYHSDPEIGGEIAMRIYKEWMRASVSGYADLVLVAEAGDRIAGYTVWKNASAAERASKVRIGHYSIGAIDPAFAGRGLFTALTHAGMQQMAQSNDYIEGPTHVGNHAVQRAYARLRWDIRGARHSFHKWLG